MTSRLHVFDMDGTLLKGAAALHLSRYFGKLDEGLDIENRWAAGQITDTEFWSTLLAICDGATETELDAAFEQAEWLDGGRRHLRGHPPTRRDGYRHLAIAGVLRRQVETVGARTRPTGPTS